MSKAFADKLKAWLLTTGISLALFLTGFYGQIALNRNETIKEHKEWLRLKEDAPRLLRAAFFQISQFTTHAPDAHGQVDRLATETLALERTLREIPAGDAGRDARTRTQDEIAKKQAEVEKLMKEEVAHYLTKTAKENIPEKILAYQTAEARHASLEQMYKARGRAKPIALFALGTLCLATMLVGMLGLFLFGVLGLFSLLGSG